MNTQHYTIVLVKIGRVQWQATIICQQIVQTHRFAWSKERVYKKAERWIQNHVRYMNQLAETREVRGVSASVTS